MKGLASFGLAGVMVFVAACADEAPRPQIAQGNQALGIASFSTDEQPTKTTILGLDAAGHEVGRVELTHGTFTLSPAYREDYDTDQVDGRKLEAVLGENHYLLEREGYEPLMNMPKFPEDEADLATLLADPHVKPVLDSWQLGFDTSSTGIDESSYAGTSYQKAGTLVQTCNGATTCGNLTRTGTNAGTYSIGTCGGTDSALVANRIAVTSTTVDEVAQCCPANTSYSYRWWARKQCAKNGLATENCGTVTAGKACIGCGVFNGNYACTVSYSAGNSYSFYQPFCMPVCNYESDCNDNHCGGTCESYRYPVAGICQ